MSLADLRKAYARAELDEQVVDRNPLRQFLAWLDEAVHAGLPEPNAMTLATASPDGGPCSAHVLLKGADDDGFVFFTDSRSRKGAELAANPRAALVFWWAELERQVRVTGRTEPIPAAQSEGVFPVASRGQPALGPGVAPEPGGEEPRRAGNPAGPTRRAATPQRGHERPPWSGRRPGGSRRYEFWQGRPNRLHDRIRYQRRAEGTWMLERLSP